MFIRIKTRLLAPYPLKSKLAASLQMFEIKLHNSAGNKIKFRADVSILLR
jgi:hypothetical protein